MKEEYFVITSREQLILCMGKLESLLNSFLQPISLKLMIKKNMFEESLKQIVPKLKFLNKGIITSLEVIRDDYQVFEEDNFSLHEEIKSNAIIKFKIPKEMSLKIHSQVIVLNDVEGTIFLMNENASITCNKMIDAKVINVKSSKDKVNLNKAYIKGDQML